MGNRIKNLKINEFTKPIVVPGGFLILQINDIKNTKIEIDIEKELKKVLYSLFTQQGYRA